MSNVGNRHWSRQTPARLPSPRKAGSVAYDPKHRVTILFGGSGLNDTWVWDGKTWVQLDQVPSPSPRMSACMVYDTSNARIMLFGGVDNSGNPLGDTWTWNGTTWTQHYPKSSPPPRHGASISYDVARKQAVLFGGETYGKRVGTLLNDTWTWDGTTWVQQAALAHPSARLGASMAYDSLHQQIVLFGGTGGSTLFNDTWLWNGTTWVEPSPSLYPTARAWASMAYDTLIQQIVLVGGGGVDDSAHPAALNDTWTWDGSTWTRLPMTIAPTGSHHSATYDASRQVIVVYAIAGSKPNPGNKKNGNLKLNTKPSWSSETWLWTT